MKKGFLCSLGASSPGPVNLPISSRSHRPIYFRPLRRVDGNSSRRCRPTYFQFKPLNHESPALVTGPLVFSFIAPAADLPTSSAPCRRADC